MPKYAYQVLSSDDLVAETKHEAHANALAASIGPDARVVEKNASKNFDTLIEAVTMHLEATFQASACGPLPMEKGGPREQALAGAFARFLPRCVGLATNSHLVRNELISPEADLLFYNGIDGWSWPIASDDGTRFMHERFAHCILEVKSVLTPAEWKKCLNKHRQWCNFYQEPLSIPFFVFAYEIPQDTRDLIWEHGNRSDMDITGIFSLDGYACVHDRYRGSALAHSITNALPLSLAESDTGYWDSEISRFVSNTSYPEHYRHVAENPAQAMLALMACVALACQGRHPSLGAFADEILSFYRKPGKHRPIHPQEDQKGS